MPPAEPCSGDRGGPAQGACDLLTDAAGAALDGSCRLPDFASRPERLENAGRSTSAETASALDGQLPVGIEYDPREAEARSNGGIRASCHRLKAQLRRHRRGGPSPPTETGPRNELHRYRFPEGKPPGRCPQGKGPEGQGFSAGQRPDRSPDRRRRPPGPHDRGRGPVAGDAEPPGGDLLCPLQALFDRQPFG